MPLSSAVPGWFRLPVLFAASLFVSGCAGRVVRPPPAPSATASTPAAPAPLPTLADLTEAGANTQDQLRTRSVRWTVSHALERGSNMVVETLRSPHASRFHFWLEGHGKRFELATLVVRDGRWYLRDRDHAGVYRPWEAPFSLPAIYGFWLQSDLRVVDLDFASELGKPVSRQGDVVLLRAPLKPEVREQLTRALDEARASLPAGDRGEGKPGVEQRDEQLRALQRLRDDGVETRVSARTGVLLEYGTLSRHTRIIDFELLSQAPPHAFDVGDLKPGPETEDPTLAPQTLGTLAMMGHCGVWEPGDKPCDPEADLVNLGAPDGPLRRIPYQGGLAIPGCFLKDRRHVVVSGSANGGMQLVDVDLSSGENRVLGSGGPLANGFSAFPVLSPDGKTLAVLHREEDETRPESQIYLVDVASGDARPLGTPLDAAFLSWTPDGKALVLLVRHPEQGSPELQDELVRLDLNGKQKTIGEGTNPLIVADKRLLFRDPHTRQWKRSGLDGKNAKPLGDGLTDLGFPTASPDGKRLLWLRFSPGTSPAPTLLDLTTLKQTPLALGKGLWTQPVWR